jgi:hypothetical protein
MTMSMLRCGRCGHENLPSYPTCGKCGASLAGAAATQAQEAQYELGRAKAAAARRNRVMYMVLGLAALGLFGAWWMRDKAQKTRDQDKLDYATRWIDLEKKETGSFWNCVMASEVDIGMFGNAGQIQQRIESAFATQQKTYSEHLITECVPRMEKAREAFAGLPPPPPELAQALDAYKKSLPELADGIEVYADRIKNRQGTKDVDQLIQEMGNAWHTDQSPNPQTIAYDKFLTCAIPGLAKLKDAQALLEFMAEQCFKKDAVSFMDRIRKQCGPVLQSPETAGPASKTYRATQKRLYEEDARQLRAWEDCGRKARKGKKVEDLGEFLVAVGEYMGARAAFAEAARGIASSR